MIAPILAVLIHRSGRELFDNDFATKETVRRDVMTAVNIAGHYIYGQRWICYAVVRAPLVALRPGFLVLLYRH